MRYIELSPYVARQQIRLRFALLLRSNSLYAFAQTLSATRPGDKRQLRMRERAHPSQYSRYATTSSR
ncbi:hypothetical protein; putative exported protein (plasmid) [Cupriavidus metallidurans CH34]|uniref:Uncharacterized protein n=1 Tax=Cupriavidus metallidurans (strain ATCC 43123 / DSM 2839 / NBRC 102507 / CH34) TaxID=266264 RepID=D3DYF1_CUPMC|nr:hypothetical protein; putative exported protein [Cupriavidus metallidurans CH34]